MWRYPREAVRWEAGLPSPSYRYAGPCHHFPDDRHPCRKRIFPLGKPVPRKGSDPLLARVRDHGSSVPRYQLCDVLQEVNRQPSLTKRHMQQCPPATWNGSPCHRNSHRPESANLRRRGPSDARLPTLSASSIAAIPSVVRVLWRNSAQFFSSTERHPARIAQHADLGKAPQTS